ASQNAARAPKCLLALGGVDPDLRSSRRASSRPPRWFAHWMSANTARIGNADAMAIDHLPALPAGKSQDHDHDEGQDQALGHDRGCSLCVTGVPIVELDQDHDDVAAGVPPGVIE